MVTFREPFEEVAEEPAGTETVVEPGVGSEEAAAGEDDGEGTDVPEEEIEGSSEEPTNGLGTAQTASEATAKSKINKK